MAEVDTGLWLQVDVPSFSGSFGILPAHVASLAVLKPGVVTVYEEDGATKKFFVSSGSITINDDSSVQILAEEAHAVEDLDAAGAKAALADVSADVHRFHKQGPDFTIMFAGPSCSFCCWS